MNKDYRELTKEQAMEMDSEVLFDVHDDLHQAVLAMNTRIDYCEIEPIPDVEYQKLCYARNMTCRKLEMVRSVLARNKRKKKYNNNFRNHFAIVAKELLSTEEYDRIKIATKLRMEQLT